MQKTDSGGMDKRTFIAFALMILVWVAFTQLMPRRPRQEPVAPEPQPTEQIAAQEPFGGPAEAIPQIEPPRGAVASTPTGGTLGFTNTLPAEEREVAIEGPLFRAVFSTRGATLKSWKLRNYTDASEELVELVQDFPGALGVQVLGPEGTLDLSRVIFAVEEAWDTRSDAPEQTRLLRFTAEGTLDDGVTPLRVERIYRVNLSRYDMEMELLVAGITNERRDHHCSISWERGIPNLETQPKLEKAAKAAVALLAEEFVKDALGGGRFSCGCPGGGGAKPGEHTHEGILRWAGVKGKYFGGLLVPEREMQATFISRTEPDRSEAGMRVVLPLDPSGETFYRFAVYAGPIDYWILRDVEERLQHDVTRVVDFGFKLIQPISKAAYWFMEKVHTVVPNYGLVIVILSIFVRLIFHPLNVKMMQSQRKMQALKPELDALNEKYKDNPEQRTKKTMELHKQHGVNPLSGCLPSLVQLPVLFALYNVLLNTIALRKEPFVLWIRDLASPDTIGEVMGIPINPLPIIMGITMFLQQKMTPTDPKQAPMLMLMPLMMIFFLYSFPSGLALYWTTMNLMQIVQQLLMKPATLKPAPAAEAKGRK